MVHVDNSFLFDGSVKNSEESVALTIPRVFDHSEYRYEFRCLQVLQNGTA